MNNKQTFITLAGDKADGKRVRRLRSSAKTRYIPRDVGLCVDIINQSFNQSTFFVGNLYSVKYITDSLTHTHYTIIIFVPRTIIMYFNLFLCHQSVNHFACLRTMKTI
jgi:hypothetical protein